MHLLSGSIALSILAGNWAVLAFPKGNAGPDGYRDILGQHLADRADSQIMIYGPNGPLIVDTEGDAAPSDLDIAAIEYAIVKCNHGWILDLLLQVVNETQTTFTPDTTSPGYYSTYNAAGVRQLVSIALPSNGTTPWWPQGLYQAWSSTQNTPGMLLPGESWDLGTKLRAVTGVPTSTFDGSSYTNESLYFAVTKGDESPVVLSSSASPQVLTPSTTYAVKSFNDSTVYLWQPGGTTNNVTISYSDLLNDLGSMSTLSDFQRWTPSAFKPCGTSNNQLICP